MAMTQQQVEQWLRDRGVAEGVIRDEAGYVSQKYADSDEDPEAVLRSSLGSYQQRSQSGGDRDSGGYSTDRNDPAMGNAGARSDSAPTYGGGFGGGGGGNNVASEWLKRYDTERAENKSRADALYNTLLQRSRQSLDMFGGPTRTGGDVGMTGGNMSPGGAGPSRTDGMSGRVTDPIIRGQVDAFGAQTERARRNYLSDVAEQRGPYANIQGERRMSAEKAGQAVGGFQAQLLGRELTARRDEIAQALAQMGGMLSGDQTRALQGELAAIDSQLRRDLGFAGIAAQRDLGFAGLDVSRRGQDMGMDQFLRQLALNEWIAGDQSDQFWFG